MASIDDYKVGMTVYGKITSYWQKEEEHIRFRCNVPEKTKCHLCLPDGKGKMLSAGSYEFVI